MGRIDLVIDENPVIDLRIDEDVGIPLEVTEQIVVEDHDTAPYRGDYTFTPSEETQTVPISGLRATDNIVINPIPEGYGRVVWNGSTLKIY